MKATIGDAKLIHINQIWKRHKPQGLGFNDTDVVILYLETEDHEPFIQDFYCRLNGSGTIGHSITKRSEKRQVELQGFIKKYISQNKRYNLRKNILAWKGKEVDVQKIGGYYIINI